MIKKLILPAILCLSLATAPTVFAQQTDEEQIAPMTEVQEVSDAQADPEREWVAAEEQNADVATGEEHKMTREEKAANARENDSWGGAITIISMCIVLSALIVLSILFLGFGKISSKLLSSKKRQAHGVSKEDAEDHHNDLDSGETIAAIAAALSEHFNGEHDLEDTILTIKRMKKAYSPWNSKIYNMRGEMDLHRNPARALPKTTNIK